MPSAASSGTVRLFGHRLAVRQTPASTRKEGTASTSTHLLSLTNVMGSCVCRLDRSLMRAWGSVSRGRGSCRTNCGRSSSRCCPTRSRSRSRADLECPTGTAPQNGRGLRHLPRPDPRGTGSQMIHAVITGGPGDSESVKPGSAGGREEEELPRQTPRRAADPTSWLHGFRRLRIRWERRDDIHEAFLGLAVCLITHRHVQRLC